MSIVLLGWTIGVGKRARKINIFVKIGNLYVAYQIEDHIKYNVEHNAKNSEYDQEIPQSQTADKPVASGGRATQQSQDT